MSNFHLVLNKAMQLKRIAVGTWVQNPSRWVIFVCLGPPKQGLCPGEINKLVVIGVQIEAGDSQISMYRSYFCNFCGLTPNSIKLLGRRPCFFGLHLRNREKSQEL